MTLKIWLHGLMAAVISGAFTSLTAALGGALMGANIYTLAFWKTVGGAVVGGVIGAIYAYLKSSPIDKVLKEANDSAEVKKGTS